MPTREKATEYVAFVVDDAGAGRVLYADPHAIVREKGVNHSTDENDNEVEMEFKYASVLVGYQCGFEPLFVAVHSYLDVKLTEEEAEEMASDYLRERKWFSGEPKPADYIIR